MVAQTKYNSLNQNVNSLHKNYSILSTWLTFSSSKPSDEISDNLGIDHIEIENTVIQTSVSIEIDQMYKGFKVSRMLVVVINNPIHSIVMFDLFSIDI